MRFINPLIIGGTIFVFIPSCQLAQVQTVQDLADLIWRTPRGLKLRTVDDETYIACLGAGRWLFSHLLSGNLSHSYWE